MTQTEKMDKSTKFHIVISIVLVLLISVLAYWVQIPGQDLKADVLSTDTVLVRIQDFTFNPDVVRIEPNTTISWLQDESEGNADVQHTVTSYDPEDSSKTGDLFESDLMSLGDTFSETFASPGVYYYNCSLHPFMTGKVCVGADSELLDEDCGIEMTETGGMIEETALDEDVLGTGDEDMLDEDFIGTGTTTTTTTTTSTTADNLLSAADELTETDLLGSADENFDTSAYEDMFTIQYDTQTTEISQTQYIPATTESQQPVGSELSSSGPEDFIYVFVALAAILITKRVYGYSS